MDAKSEWVDFSSLAVSNSHMRCAVTTQCLEGAVSLRVMIHSGKCYNSDFEQRFKQWQCSKSETHNWLMLGYEIHTTCGRSDIRNPCTACTVISDQATGNQARLHKGHRMDSHFPINQSTHVQLQALRKEWGLWESSELFGLHLILKPSFDSWKSLILAAYKKLFEQIMSVRHALIWKLNRECGALRKVEISTRQ